MPLTSRQIRYLRGLTHHLQPVVMIGDKGLSENVQMEIDTALEHHELIKIKLRADRETRSALIRQISELSGAEKIHSIGQVACFFKRNAKKPVIELPSKN
jgi:RNA-binding protein